MGSCWRWLIISLAITFAKLPNIKICQVKYEELLEMLLQERDRDEPIPELSSNSGDSMTPRLLLNSTKPKDYARNAREERCEVCGVCVF